MNLNDPIADAPVTDEGGEASTPPLDPSTVHPVVSNRQPSTHANTRIDLPTVRLPPVSLARPTPADEWLRSQRTYWSLWSPPRRPPNVLGFDVPGDDRAGRLA